MIEPKFKVGDLVTSTAGLLQNVFRVERVRSETTHVKASYELTEVHTKVKDFAYESSLRLLTSEEKTKLLLGIDLYE